MRKTIYAVVVLILLCAATAVFGQKVSDEARRYFDRAMAAVEMAKTPADYEKAVAEFEKAKALAPDWPDVYYNLGFIQDKASMYSEAMENLRKYLLLAPDAEDAEAVRTLINKLDYKKEQIGDKYGKFTDPRDGNTYKTVKIGNQVWLAENLKYDAAGACVPPGKDEGAQILYGCRYVWLEALTVCPTGWHLPTTKECNKLIDTFGRDPETSWKSKRIEEHGCPGTNQSGFNAVPLRKEDDFITWWSITKESAKSIWEKDKYYGLLFSCKKGWLGMTATRNKKDLFPVRCIKD